MTNKEKQNLYNEAIAFYELAECGRKNIPEQKHVESHIPYIVNMTFCSELLLKFLLIEEGKSTKEVRGISHNLNSLYANLSLKTKKHIHSLIKQPLVYSIETELHKSKNAFVYWRYLVLDKIDTDTEDDEITADSETGEKTPSEEKTPKDNRIPFEKWLCLSPSEQDEITCTENQRNRISPFFLKEFNEVLIKICKSHCN